MPVSGQEVFLWPRKSGQLISRGPRTWLVRVGPLDSDKQGDTGYAGDVDEVDFGRRQTERSLAPMAKVVVTDYFERLQAPQHELIDTAPRTEIAKTSPQVAPPNRVRPTDSIASKTLAQASWSHAESR